jgi:trk system potassium uptake protein TrkA
MFVIIVGGGKTGSHLAELLLAAGHKVRVIDRRPEVIEKLKAELPPDTVVRGDGADPKVLIDVGIKNAHVVAAVTTTKITWSCPPSRVSSFDSAG